MNTFLMLILLLVIGGIIVFTIEVGSTNVSSSPASAPLPVPTVFIKQYCNYIPLKRIDRFDFLDQFSPPSHHLSKIGLI